MGVNDAEKVKCEELVAMIRELLDKIPSSLRKCSVRCVFGGMWKARVAGLIGESDVWKDESMF